MNDDVNYARALLQSQGRTLDKLAELERDVKQLGEYVQALRQQLADAQAERDELYQMTHD